MLYYDIQGQEHYGSVYSVSVYVFNLHAILPCDGESVVWVVHKGHVDSNQGRTICSEHLPSDNGHQAAKKITHMVGKKPTHTHY